MSTALGQGANMFIVRVALWSARALHSEKTVTDVRLQTHRVWGGVRTVSVATQ